MNRLNRSRRGFLAAGLALSSPVRAAAPATKVVASFSILADMVREVGGPHVEVAALVGPESDAHVFEPTPRDALALRQAGVLVANGLGFEAWLPRLKKAAGFKGLEVVASQGLKARVLAAHDRHGHDHHGHAGRGHLHDSHTDPHAWQDVANGIAYVRNIAAGLARADPAHAADYRVRAAAYAARLQALDARIRARLASIPVERRVVITAHDAFGYFAEAYGVRFLTAGGLSTGVEPSAADLAGLIRQIREQHASAVFLENIADPRLMERLARETGAAVGGRLHSDALSRPGTPGDSYAGMMEANAAALSAALTSSAASGAPAAQ